MKTQYRNLTTRAGHFTVDLSRLERNELTILTVSSAGTLQPFATIGCQAGLSDRDLRSYAVKQINVAIALIKAQADYKTSGVQLHAETLPEQGRGDRRKMRGVTVSTRKPWTKSRRA